MFKKIMVPVDLTHREKLTHSLQCAADLAKLYEASLVYVGVTSGVPSSVAHNPAEYQEKLADFAKDKAASLGISSEAHTKMAHDPATEIDDALLEAAEEIGADLIVMQSHVPGLIEYVWPSNGGKVAEHAKCSVLLVRG
jgi:nucleotide-binding universal stress UspA family protein